MPRFDTMARGRGMTGVMGDAGRVATGALERRASPPVLPLDFNAVVVGECAPDDLLQVPSPAGGSEPFPLRQPRLAAPDGLPPEQVHSPPPPSVEERRRPLQGVVHARINSPSNLLPTGQIPRRSSADSELMHSDQVDKNDRALAF